MAKFYLTTAIDYSNGEPHVGHAYEKIGADCIARYRRLAGDEVRFVIGMDEHGQNVAQSAETAGVPTQRWVDDIAAQFQAAWRTLTISYDDFIRTTEPRHVAGVHALLKRIQEAGHIYAGTYAGYYCVGCEAFKLEKDLVDGRCPDHPTLEIRWVEEPNYFFRLSSFRNRLLQHYDAHPDFLRPPERMNEIRNLVEQGLEDISVSRARLPWGIPFPGAAGHTVYVWFDALINYLSATGFPSRGYERVWPADLHVIGPDITRFHCVIWPAMLMAAELEVPKGVWSHGWMTFGGARFSKTAGVRFTLDEAIARHGPDALRYFLLREVAWDASGEFSLERFDARYISELADTLGNLVSRTLSMIHRYRSGTVPKAPKSIGSRFDSAVTDSIVVYQDWMDDHRLHDGAAEMMSVAASANRYVEDSAPWKLAKEGKEAELDLVLANLARTVVRLAILAYPFIPGKAEVIWSLVCPGLRLERACFEEAVLGVEGRAVGKPPILFPKPRADEPTARNLVT